MSAVLGPIHHFMYGKIRCQEALIDAIIDTAKKNGWQMADGTNFDELTNPEDRPLEDIIDLSNIHGWLTSHIDGPENRYAELVTGLLDGHAERFDTIRQTVYDFGRQHGAKAADTAQDAYRALTSALLDGMPCDRAVAVTDNEADHVAWRQVTDMHSDYWTEVGGDGKIYYKLRMALIDGMLADSPWQAKQDGDSYSITAA